MKNLQNSLGTRIKEARIKAGMSQKDLAERVGFESPTAISLIESDQRGVSVDILRKIGEVLHLDIDYLLSGKKNDEAVNIKYALRADKELGETDEKQILNFIDFIKNQKKK